jgi:hypothetical protein
VTGVRLAAGESAGLADYLDRLLRLDGRAAVRIQADGGVAGFWCGPPLGVVALRPAALADAASVDVTVSAGRLRERLTGGAEVELPGSVPGPAWVGLLPPRSGWQERARGSVRYVREAVVAAKEAFALRADGVTDRRQLDAAADEVWRRACLAEVPVRAAHAAESLGLLGPGSGEVVAYAVDGWLRLSAPGGSVAVRREPLPGLTVLG